MDFVFSLFILISIPIFSELYSYYGIKKYLKHILAASMILVVYMVMIFLYFSQYSSWNPMAYALNETKIFGTLITYRESGVQVSVVMAGWLTVALLVAYYKLIKQKRIYYFICIIMILIALFISKSAGLWLSVFLSCTLFNCILKRFSSMYSIIIILFILFLGFMMFHHEDIMDLKIESIEQKSEQTEVALQIYSDNQLFGKGLGYLYQSSEVSSMSGQESTILEATYPMILSSTGLIGAFFYVFILLYYPIRFFTIRMKNTIMKLIFVCYFAILIAAVGNPYLWGGGLGLFLMCMLAASIETTFLKKQKERVC